MTPEAFSRMRALFEAAMALPSGVRRAFVESHLAADDPVRAELLAMVDAGDDSAFLAPGAWGRLAPTLVAEGFGPQLQIGRYKVLKELGRGGMGVVYLALRDDDVFRKVVALKVIGEKGASQSDFVQRFKQERQILAGLDHPNIARILDGGDTDDGRPFYVMEYIAGSPIHEYCQQTGADMAARVRMVIDVCQAVEYLHEHAIAHRDIKPGNILVGPDGRIKLVDFGVAKVDTVDGMVATPSPPGQPTLIMTPGYASPEQVSGRPSGKSGDLYSIGVVLYRLLAGRLPYVDEDGHPNIAAQLSGDDPAPPCREWKEQADTPGLRTDAPGVSRPDLDRVVLTALRRDPLQRYASVQMFAEDLRRCLDGRPIVARPENPLYRFRKLVFRNRIAASLAALLMAASMVGGWISVEARIDRARIEAKESEVERFIALFSAKVESWPTKAVPEAEKVRDLQAANQLMASDTMRSLSAKTPNPGRVKRLVSDLRGVLDRADTLSAGGVRVRKEITLVYRMVGDFEANPSRRVWDRQGATDSYKRAAAVAASLGVEDRAWAEAQVADLARLLQALGSPLDIRLAQAEMPKPAEPAPPPRASPVAPVTKPVTPVVFRPPVAKELSPDDVPVRDDLARRLKTSTSKAAQARVNLESLRSRLAATGQTIRPDLLTSIGGIDALLEEAKSALDLNDLPAAEDHLHRADYELRKLWQTVGS